MSLLGGTTEDRNDPRLTHGVDESPGPQAEVYLVLSEEERAKGFVRPYRSAYTHVLCPRYSPERFSQETRERLAVTTMGRALSETYARDPKFYGATYCTHCGMHRAVSEFRWVADGKVVGS